jgi:hypothetical protein
MARKDTPQMWAANGRIRFWLTCFIILSSILLPCIRSTFAIAEGPLAFVNTQPPDALENEDYAWQITVTGGQAPYSCNVTGALPPGLFFNTSQSAISGKPSPGITTSRYTLVIKATDSSNPPLSIEAPFVINVQYRANISTTSALSGETNVYVDGQQVAKLQGGEKTSRIFTSGTKHTISVDASASAPSQGNVRLKPVIDQIVVDGLSPDAIFDYSSEYEITVKCNQPDIPPLPGSGWYKTDSPLDSAAPAQIEPKPGIQYRFAHWLLPTGEVLGDTKLDWKVTKPGEVLANYDTYYELTVNSDHCEVDGGGWYKAGDKARWSVKCSQSVPAPGFWGHLGAELKPEQDTGTMLMDSPKEVNVVWNPDYSKIIIPVVTGVIAATVIAVLGILHERSKRVVAKIREQRLKRKP